LKPEKEIVVKENEWALRTWWGNETNSRRHHGEEVDEAARGASKHKSHHDRTENRYSPRYTRTQKKPGVAPLSTIHAITENPTTSAAIIGRTPRRIRRARVDRKASIDSRDRVTDPISVTPN
jgi:hypothetical protein